MSFVVLSYFLILSLVCASEDQPKVEAKAGDDITLQCRVPRGASVILLEWNKSVLKSKGYVFFFRENRSYNSSQLPLFRGRVKLNDPKMSDGDVSVILKNVNVNDTGTYECRVIISNSGHDEITQQCISLTVKDPDEFVDSESAKFVDSESAKFVDSESGHTAGKVMAEENKRGHHGVVLSVTGVLLSVFIGCMVFMNRKKLKALLKRKNTYGPAGGEDAT